jgi:cellulose synthase/poly-beta-1,6-N-acetylglucosamine synthase-like glycosyltransferase
VKTCVAVIPARRAEKTIAAALESLRLGSDDVVSRIVVVTSSSDPTAAVVREWAARDARVELVVADRSLTAGAARNAGRTASRSAELLLFMDADCRLEAGGARRLARGLEGAGLAAIGARIEREGGLVSRVRHMLEFKEAASRHEPPAEWIVPSTALLCRTEDFDRAGGFPDLWPGEDLVLGHRMRSLGMRTARSRDVTCVHTHPDGLVEMLRHQWRLGRTAAAARRMAPMHGSVFAHVPWLAPLLFPARLARLAAWQLREGRGEAAWTLLLLPLVVAGLASWTCAFTLESATTKGAESKAWRRRGAEMSA